jgi:hypothetical protein
MKVHIYDALNRNKLAQLRGEEFSSINVSHNIDDMSTARLTSSLGSNLQDILTKGLENIYIEDDDGSILFGGVFVGTQVSPTQMTLTCYDHRWVLMRLILDAPMTLLSSENVLDVVETLINQAKAKRNIPIDFNREGSAINDDDRADLHFEVGDSIGGCLQKIIQTIYARWAMRYTKTDNDITGRLIIRSVRGVTPEGVGIARTPFHSEDGSVVRLYYGEGNNKSNIEDFSFTQDFSDYFSRVKVGARINGEPQFFDIPNNMIDPVTAFYEFLFGRMEKFITDYNANSATTALILSKINQSFGRLDAEIQLAPTFTRRLNCGDRVEILIQSPLVKGLDANFQPVDLNAQVRIDAINYERRDGYWAVKMTVNFMSPQKRLGTTGFLQAMGNIQQALDALNKNYFNNSGS